MTKVWINGCFDILHIGHIKLFEYAKSLGDLLIVGIDSDRRVNKLKGTDRPTNNEKSRKEFLEAITYIDKVFIFDSEKDLKKLILKNSDLIVVGSDYKNKNVIGSEHSDVIFFDRIKDCSTTQILKEINDQNNRA